MFPEWTRLPVPPIPYPFWRRVGDRWHGWKDARKGIPHLPPEPADESDAADGTPPRTPDDDARPVIVTTPTLSRLQDAALEWIAAERNACVYDCDPHEEDFEAAVTALGTLREQVDEARRRLDALLKPDSGDPPRRRASELGRTAVSDDLIQRRRLKEHERERDEVLQLYFTVKRQCDAQTAAIGKHRSVITYRWRIASQRAQARMHHYRQRAAVYSQQLVRTHRDGPRLNGLLPHAEPDLPGWVADPDGQAPPFDEFPTDPSD